MLLKLSNILRIILEYLDSFFKKYKNINSSKNTILDIHKESTIIINHRKFILGATWSKYDPFKTLLVLRKNATLIVKDKFRIYTGAKIYINKGAQVSLGSGYINHNLNLSCFKSIEIGNNVSISENVTIRDSDNHLVISEDKKAICLPIKIGDSVWVGINVTILKGVTVGDGAVIAAGSVVIKDIPANSLAAGVPAKIIKNNIRWE